MRPSRSRPRPVGKGKGEDCAHGCTPTATTRVRFANRIPAIANRIAAGAFARRKSQARRHAVGRLSAPMSGAHATGSTRPPPWSGDCVAIRRIETGNARRNVRCTRYPTRSAGGIPAHPSRYEFAANVEQNREAENADQDVANEIASLYTRARDTAEGGLASNAISIGANAASPLPFRMADGVAYPIEDSGGSHLVAGRPSARLSSERFGPADVVGAQEGRVRDARAGAEARAQAGHRRRRPGMRARWLAYSMS
jgi:hypothetical protein